MMLASKMQTLCWNRLSSLLSEAYFLYWLVLLNERFHCISFVRTHLTLQNLHRLIMNKTFIVFSDLV